MSLILEALKKSDAERQRSTAAPQVAMVSAGHSGQRLFRIGLLLSAVAITAALVWTFSRQRAESTVQPQARQPTEATRAEVAPLPAKPVGAAEPSVAEPVADAAVVAQPAQIQTSAPKPTVTPTPSSTATPIPANDDLVVSEPQQQPTIEVTPPQEPALVDLQVETIEPLVTAPKPRPVAGESARETLPTFSQLPSAVQSEIGELTLNVHVFADQAAERFVLINLRRYQQGDQLNQRLRVSEIRADGAVLDFEGRLFLLDTRFQ